MGVQNFEYLAWRTENIPGSLLISPKTPTDIFKEYLMQLPEIPFYSKQFYQHRIFPTNELSVPARQSLCAFLSFQFLLNLAEPT